MLSLTGLMDGGGGSILGGRGLEYVHTLKGVASFQVVNVSVILGFPLLILLVRRGLPRLGLVA